MKYYQNLAAILNFEKNQHFEINRKLHKIPKSTMNQILTKNLNFDLNILKISFPEKVSSSSKKQTNIPTKLSSLSVIEAFPSNLNLKKARISLFFSYLSEKKILCVFFSFLFCFSYDTKIIVFVYFFHINCFHHLVSQFLFFFFSSNS